MAAACLERAGEHGCGVCQEHRWLKWQRAQLLFAVNLPRLIKIFNALAMELRA